MKGLIDKINERGLANGWHAQQLFDSAKHYGTTMAELFCTSLMGQVAYCVPAKCTKVSSRWIYYEFLDGSTERFPNINAKI